jgi:hypothetical protein
MRSRDDGVSEAELTVEFEDARLDGERARGRSGRTGPVDDPDLRAELGQPKRQNETGRPRADHEDIAILQRSLRSRSYRPLLQLNAIAHEQQVTQTHVHSTEKAVFRP